MMVSKFMPFFVFVTWILVSFVAGKFGALSSTGRNLLPVSLVTFPTTEDYVDDGFNLKLTPENIEKAIDFAKDVVINKTKVLESNLKNADIHTENGTPAHGLLIDSLSEEQAIEQGTNALIAGRASLYIMNIYCPRFTPKSYQCVKELKHTSLNKTSLKSICRINDQIYCENSPYRQIDGKCNNLAAPSLGKTFTTYKRLLPAAYQDGIQEPRTRAVSKKILPNPRVVSNAMCKNVNVLDIKNTLAFMQWGQFVFNDLAHTANRRMITTHDTIECCESSGVGLSPRHQHPDCMQIKITDDPYYSKRGVTCMSYVRSMVGIRPGCTFGPLEQMNQASHFLDGSQIYGSCNKIARSLRQFYGGRLLTTVNDNAELLPISKNPLQDCQVKNKYNVCFRSGDLRVNSQPLLTVMHTLWVREHNRIANELSLINSIWDDEKLFQESRKIVIAQMQHITYEEWKPILLGPQNDDVSLLLSRSEFMEHVDPSVTNSFANAASRFVQSLMEGTIRLYSEDRKVNSTIKLHDHYNNPAIVIEKGYFDYFIRSLSSQQSQASDIHFVSDLTDELYKGKTYGYDVFSIDIQRGRDHGLPSYNSFREYCGLKKANVFDDFRDTIPKETLNEITKIYTNPNDVDLIVGGLAEKVLPGAVVGPTFTCILSEQLLRTKQGDRYFYSHTNDNTAAFSPEQINEIRKANLARIFCDNGDNIKQMQPNVFQKISEKNQLVSCNDETAIPRLNLQLWRENQEKFS